ncbi:MAG TPA: dephospho-CoA kinase [Deltaproteobacteria bacterium]|jgi:dephospho-CoA kinase|nr:dephospho-CoA kinase [Deltaproteobacteria bacterium]MDI9541626.1 dephospho-CoA kinase [Pseudomonadota bacterium]NLW67855.1 dephospho-CoA kinase [Bacteriovoracaceae bacterium]HRR20134.1 dephospho-CoA kinase [Desulfomonilia bacterium]HNR50956.1 dephospho-CoA kinase [Deltaproteobacteria bacterium]
MVIAGLTGGIATGKSTVASLFASFGAAVIDADRIAREVVLRGSPAFDRIVEHFGREILLPDGEIDRDRLGGIIFSDSGQRESLNRIVHPEVFREMNRRIGEIKSGNVNRVVICDVPLLIETGMHSVFDDVILVYVPEPLQINRLMEREGIGRDEALRRVRAQMSIEEKKPYASHIIDNSGTRENTAKITLEVYRSLEERSRRCGPCRHT